MLILVADDNREIRAALRIALLEVSDHWEAEQDAPEMATTAPCTILEAEDATEVLVLLKNRDVNVMLIDWELPGLDAAGVLPQMRAHLSGCTVIAMSGLPETREQALRSGADHFVGRNDPPARLLELLRELWTSSRD